MSCSSRYDEERPVDRLGIESVQASSPPNGDARGSVRIKNSSYRRRVDRLSHQVLVSDLRACHHDRQGELIRHGGGGAQKKRKKKRWTFGYGISATDDRLNVEKSGCLSRFGSAAGKTPEQAKNGWID